jgi:hypothetical protein
MLFEPKLGHIFSGTHDQNLKYHDYKKLANWYLTFINT